MKGGLAQAVACPDFVASHPDLEMLETGKCRCRLTGHEMATQKDVVEVSGCGRRYPPELRAQRGLP
jgi:hypothetical protein